MKIAAKTDAKSGYNIQPVPYCVFITVNRNETMNTHATIIAGFQEVPDISGTTAPAPAGMKTGVAGLKSSGIRGAGQYCCRPVHTRTEPTMTAHRTTRGMMAVCGMGP